MIIAAAYVRVSTDEQTDYSPAAQLADIKEYARNNGYHIPEEFFLWTRAFPANAPINVLHFKP